jgi:hypothetical protein
MLEPASSDYVHVLIGGDPEEANPGNTGGGLGGFDRIGFPRRGFVGRRDSELERRKNGRSGSGRDQNRQPATRLRVQAQGGKLQIGADKRSSVTGCRP